jgi:hypothetical protein
MKNRPDLYQKISKAETFLVLGTEAFYNDALCYAQVEIAKDCKKPFYILQKKGVPIPENFLDEIGKYEIYYWSDKEELQKLFEDYIEKIADGKKGIKLISPY